MSLSGPFLGWCQAGALAAPPPNAALCQPADALPRPGAWALARLAALAFPWACRGLRSATSAARGCILACLARLNIMRWGRSAARHRTHTDS